jgi:cell division protein FtsB
MKWLAAALLVLVLLLQHRLWLSDDGVQELTRLKSEVEAQRADNDQLAERNRQLAAEVRDLKSGFTALEERARSDLGMIGRNETFYQVTPRNAVSEGGEAPGAPRTRTAAAPPR